MGCEESYIGRSTYSGRAKIGSLKKNIKHAYKSKKKKLMNSLKQGTYQLTDQDWNMVQHSLINHQLLFKARGYANKDIMNRLQNFHVKAGNLIFKRGDPSNYFYIVIKGKVQISNWAEGQHNKTIERGACFGDMGIYNKTTRSATTTALEDTELVGLQKENFLRISMELSKRAQNQVFNQIKNIPIFKQLTLHQKHKLSYLAQQLKFKKDTVIFKRGQISSCLYIIKAGKVLLTIPDKESIEVKAKQSFGQSCLSNQKPQRFADAVCLQTTTLLAFSKADIQKYLDRQLFDLQTINKLIWAFKHDKNLKVSSLVLDSMIDMREIHYYTNNQVIAEKGQRITHLIVSLQGGINNHTQLQVFNTDFLLDIKCQTQNLVKTGAGDVAFISIQSIQKRFHRNFNSLIDLNQSIWKHIESLSKIQEYVSTLALSSFHVIENKGVGDLGCTLKVRSQSNIQFALRVIQKHKAIKEGDVQQIVNLKSMGSKLYHNLIAKQYRVYSDQHRLYFMSRWVQGEDLYDFMTRMKKLSISIARHFSACIISILEYLHRRRTLWRQLKVQSFVIDHHGYLNLIDLTYLQQLQEDNAFIQNPLKATFYYLAPQILSSQGHGFQTDFWSLGVILYKMIVGQFPYGAGISMEDDKVLDQLADQIQNKPLSLPSWLTSDVKIILKILLNPNPMERSLISFSKLKGLSFFRDYDWLGLIQKKIKNIPYIPKLATQKATNPISFNSWAQHQISEIPPASILDNIHQIHNSSKK